MTRGVVGTAVLNPHGTAQRYKAGCRCSPCTAANTRSHKIDLLNPGRMRPAIGARRRLRALAALGWSCQALAAELGWSGSLVSLVQRSSGEQTLPSTDEAIRAVYDRLSMTPPPARTAGQRSAATRARNHALRKGWTPPLAWDDDTIDDPAAAPDLGGRGDDVIDELAVARVLAGEAVHLNRAERAEVIPVLAARGMSDVAIAALVGCVAETVLRARAALGVESRWCA